MVFGCYLTKIVLKILIKLVRISRRRIVKRIRTDKWQMISAPFGIVALVMKRLKCGHNSFEDLSTPLDRAVYIEKIYSFVKNRGFKGKYKKSKKKLFDFLVNNGGDANKAIKYAKRKDPGTGKIKPNSSTGLYIFVGFFKAYFA